jgi:anti-anti-sigma factor
MTVEARLTNNDEEMVISVSGHFDFTIANDFRNCYRNDPPKKMYIIDLAAVEFIDSAAIGMILLLREYTNNNAAIRVINCKPGIKKVLEISHIDRFVEIAA